LNAARGRWNAPSTAIGERAGNAALEEIVMTIRTRRDHYNITTNIDTTKIYPASRMVSSLTGLVVSTQQGDRRRKRLRA